MNYGEMMPVHNESNSLISLITYFILNNKLIISIFMILFLLVLFSISEGEK